jgi:hypothetical protein
VTMTVLRPVQEGQPALPDRVARDGYEALLEGNDSVVGGFRKTKSERELQPVEQWRRLA